MISSSKPPSRLRKALALPVLLAVMALACSKEQSAPAAKTKQLPGDVTVRLMLNDSFHISALKTIFLHEMVTNLKNGKGAYLTVDTLGRKMQLDHITAVTFARKVVLLSPPRIVADNQ